MLINLFDSRLRGGDPCIYPHLHQVFHLSFVLLLFYLFLGPSINSNLLLRTFSKQYQLCFSTQTNWSECNTSKPYSHFLIFLVGLIVISILHQTYPLFLKVAYDWMKKDSSLHMQTRHQIKALLVCMTVRNIFFC